MATRRTSDSTPTPKPVSPTRAKPAAAPPATATLVRPTTAQPANTKNTAPKPEPRKRAAKPKVVPATAARAEVSAETRRAMIAESAYLRAERRGFASGYEVEDWCAAEREVDALLSADANAAAQ
jgi:hypothetical protein